MHSAFYGLKQEPFRLTPDPRFLHLAEPHRNTLCFMLEGISQRKGLQVLVGPIGTGKTTLLYCLQHILASEARNHPPIRSAFIVNPTLTPDELHEALVDELELTAASPSKPARLRAIHELLMESYNKNGVVLIIIDEAHLLSPVLMEEVRLLLNLDNYPIPVLQIILCGQPELVMQPQIAALRGRVAVVSKLRVLTFQEMCAYVADRLHVAGLSGENPFLPGALEEVYRRSSGAPRLINLYCDSALAAGFRRQARKITPDLVAEAVEGLALTDESYVLTGGERPELVMGRSVSEGLFATLGVKPLKGRAFLSTDDRPSSTPVAVISYGLWQRRFGGKNEDEIVGSQITLDQKSYTIVGILPRDFDYRDVVKPAYSEPGPGSQDQTGCLCYDQESKEP